MWDRYFYLSMSLLIAAIVVYGFSHTINDNLLHATPIRPWFLYLHGAVFSGWVVFFILQTSLVSFRNVRLHRTLGWFGVALGCVITLLGPFTAIGIARFKISHHIEAYPQFLSVPLWDITSFTAAFALAIYWRRRPEFHRRLMYVATCALTAAAFGRFPWKAFQDNWFYTGVDVLILCGITRDLVVTGRVHPVYRWALPILILGQSFAIYLSNSANPVWMRIVHGMVG
jgi:hypothetical protein